MAESEVSTQVPVSTGVGRLTISEKAVSTIAERAVTGTDGVLDVEASWPRRSSPQVRAQVAGGRARITVRLTSTWPTPLADLIERVRGQVSDQVTSMTGLRVDAVDVHVMSVEPDLQTEPAARVEAPTDLKPLTDAESQPLAPGPVPRRGVSVTVIALGLAAGLLAVSVFALLDCLRAWGILSGEQSLGSALVWAGTLAPGPVVVVAGALCVALGLTMIIAASRRRRPTAHAVTATTGVYLMDVSLEQLLEHDLAELDGVLSTRVRVRPKRVRVHVVATADDPDLRGSVENVITKRLAVLKEPGSLQLSIANR